MHDAAAHVLPAVPLVGVVDRRAEGVDCPVVRPHGQEVMLSTFFSLSHSVGNNKLERLVLAGFFQDNISVCE